MALEHLAGERCVSMRWGDGPAIAWRMYDKDVNRSVNKCIEFKSGPRSVTCLHFNLVTDLHNDLKIPLILILLSASCASAAGAEQENTAEEWYQKSMDLIANQSYDESPQAFDKALERDPGNITHAVEMLIPTASPLMDCTVRIASGPSWKL